MARGDPGFPRPLNAVQSSMSSTKAGARLDSPRFHLLQGMYLDVGFVTQLQVGKIFSAVPLLVARECLPGFRYMQRRAIPRTTSRNLKGGDRLRFEPNLGLGALLFEGSTGVQQWGRHWPNNFRWCLSGFITYQASMHACNGSLLIYLEFTPSEFQTKNLPLYSSPGPDNFIPV